jgi:hypothetical protein
MSRRLLVKHMDREDLAPRSVAASAFGSVSKARHGGADAQEIETRETFHHRTHGQALKSMVQRKHHPHSCHTQCAPFDTSRDPAGVASQEVATEGTHHLSLDVEEIGASHGNQAKETPHLDLDVEEVGASGNQTMVEWGSS